MVGEDDLLDLGQSRARRADLRHDIEAVAILFDHLMEAANLTLDTRQPGHDGLFCLGVHRFTPAMAALQHTG